eukprot:m.313479 g.313479  ORF g.313479 m.313479 type:complete len:52 (+) comp27483_c1_seq1:2066-2221(+)
MNSDWSRFSPLRRMDAAQTKSTPGNAGKLFIEFILHFKFIDRGLAAAAAFL